jgi:methionyl-tRNA formyltransferase
MSIDTPCTIVVAGSTARTRLCAESLAEDPRFEITGILTPSPRAIGRQQVVTQNPLHIFAEQQNIPFLLIDKKIPKPLTFDLRPSFLLVVDFGYIVPSWLLEWPTIAPVNIHPSDLPKYRGSSPGQFALVFGETESAVTIMQMDEKLDHGPIITKIPFVIDPEWTAPEYYEHAFSLVTDTLTDILCDFAVEKKSTPQPDDSPSPVARMLKRDDGFVPLATLEALLKEEAPEIPVPFLESYSLATSRQSLYNLWRGLTPWPGLWTTITRDGQEKRMKLLSFHINDDKLYLDTVQVEGKNAVSFDSMQSLQDD